MTIFLYSFFRRADVGGAFQERGYTPWETPLERGSWPISALSRVTWTSLAWWGSLTPELAKEKGRHGSSGQAAKAIISLSEE